MKLRRTDSYQVGGTHYNDMAIQPVVLWDSYLLFGHEAVISKYACRWKSKGGRQDLSKAVHHCEFLLDSAARAGEARRLLAEHFDMGKIISVAEFIDANSIPGHEGEALINICQWAMSGDEGFVRNARNAIIELIHVERTRNQERPR
ncbi:MAG: hypothetical protein AAGI72_23585 [Pseudomonadota bacterium]